MEVVAESRLTADIDDATLTVSDLRVGIAGDDVIEAGLPAGLSVLGARDRTSR